MNEAGCVLNNECVRNGGLAGCGSENIHNPGLPAAELLCRWALEGNLATLGEVPPAEGPGRGSERFVAELCVRSELALCLGNNEVRASQELDNIRERLPRLLENHAISFQAFSDGKILEAYAPCTGLRLKRAPEADLIPLIPQLRNDLADLLLKAQTAKVHTASNTEHFFQGGHHPCYESDDQRKHLIAVLAVALAELRKGRIIWIGSPREQVSHSLYRLRNCRQKTPIGVHHGGKEAGKPGIAKIIYLNSVNYVHARSRRMHRGPVDTLSGSLLRWLYEEAKGQRMSQDVTDMLDLLSKQTGITIDQFEKRQQLGQPS